MRSKCAAKEPRRGTDSTHVGRTGSLVAYVDDERFGNGVYEFRAHATDRAGNDSSIGPRDAGAATLRLPVRGVTRLRVGARRVKIRKRVIRQGGRRRTVKRRVVTLSQRVTARLGRSVRLHGRLLNEDGQPLEGAAVQVLDDASGQARLLATVQAGGDGWFRYRLRANHNRTIRFRYPGSRRIGAAESTVRLTVPAASTINVKPRQVFNGGSVEFRGRVRTTPIPLNGKLLEMQAYFRGRWRTFSTVRSDLAGRWYFPYQFGGTTGRVLYRFRVLLPVEGGYPFGTGISPVVRVLVTGP